MTERQWQKNKSDFGRLISASIFSWQGFVATFKTEAGFRQECFSGFLLVPLSFIIADSVVTWLLLIISYLLVLFAEIINTSVESVVDRLGEEWHELSGKAKDAGSAAVFLTIVIAILTWSSLLLEKLF